MSKPDMQLSEDDFEAQFRRLPGQPELPEENARARQKRETRMRSPHADGRHAKFTGRTVQFNCKVKPTLKAKFTTECKKRGVSLTLALEQALEAWIAGGGHA
jgi:hypothetical protein